MKSIHERAEIGNAIDKATGYTYCLRTDDLEELYNRMKSESDYGYGIMAMVGEAHDAGFYAGISCAINRGFNKTNDPRKAATKEVACK